ncbi:hypothetical protein FBD94_20145 [Pedobacter hiemivivus]|uniref:Lipoprotein n=1 Tax=Pedobacter hiemivivus TaxID=2530454 RepID=A0A4U1G315_9SPHI|nr:hypothetical protein [Pedobacter hiemivivus]TKC57594.1 hypothetical protein FBD94_20145 [Pedobacter hiemivivus]
MKSKYYLFSIISLLIFIASCKKSSDVDAPETKQTVGKAKFSFTPLSKDLKTSFLEADSAYFTVMVTSNPTDYCYVSLFYEGTTSNPFAVKYFEGSTSPPYTFQMLLGTRFYIHTTTALGSTFDSQVVEAGTVGGVTISIPSN